MIKVTTYQAPDDRTIDLTRRQEAMFSRAGQWPRNASGEYCQVSHGLHAGSPTWDDEQVRGMIRETA